LGSITNSAVLHYEVITLQQGGSVAEWLTCWTQAQKARFQIAVATLSGNSLRQTFHTHRASVYQAAKLVAALLRVIARVTTGLAKSMAAYRRVYDSRHLQDDCQEPGSTPEPYWLGKGVWATFAFYLFTLQYTTLTMAFDYGIKSYSTVCSIFVSEQARSLEPSYRCYCQPCSVILSAGKLSSMPSVIIHHIIVVVIDWH